MLWSSLEDYKEELLAGRLEINDIIADSFLQQTS